MRNLLLLIALPLFLVACGGAATAPAKSEAAPATTAAVAPKAASSAATGELSGGPFPANEIKTYKVVPSLDENCCFNGIGWEKGSTKGSAILLKGDELAIESPNSFGDSLRTLTFKVIGYDSVNNVIFTKVADTKAFGEGALNNFWASVPFAKVSLIMSPDNRSMQFRFGEPADTIEQAVAPKISETNPKLLLRSN